MEHLNQAPNSGIDTIPDVERINDISIGVWDDLGKKLGALSMGFDLPVALSPKGVETSIIAATVSDFGNGPNTEVNVSPHLITEINEIGQMVLAGNEHSIGLEQAIDTTEDYTDPTISDPSDTSDMAPLLYAEGADDTFQTNPKDSLPDDPNTVPLVLIQPDTNDLPVVESSAFSESMIVAPTEELVLSKAEYLRVSENKVFEQYVDLEPVAISVNDIVDVEAAATLKSEDLRDKDQVQFLGSKGVEKLIDLVIIEEPTYEITESEHLTLEDILTADQIAAAHQEGPAMHIYAGSL